MRQHATRVVGEAASLIGRRCRRWVLICEPGPCRSRFGDGPGRRHATRVVGEALVKAKVRAGRSARAVGVSRVYEKQGGAGGVQDRGQDAPLAPTSEYGA